MIRRMRMRRTTMIALMIGAALGAVLGIGGAMARAGSQPPVYVCAAWPCTAQYGQLETISDKYGQPIWSVPQYGGPLVSGDNLRVQRGVYSGGVTISPWSPQDYYAAQVPPVPVPACQPGTIWIYPNAIDKCTAARTWHVSVALR